MAPEFSRLITADKVGKDGQVLDVAANAEEQAALARRFGLNALERLEGRARLRPIGDGRIGLRVTFDADVLQSCVITLEPVASNISGYFEVVYAPTGEGEDEAEVFIDMASDDPPEPLIEGKIDIGEIMAQHLAMLINPYPRAPDAPDGAWHTDAEVEAAAPAGPFDKLKLWKSRG